MIAVILVAIPLAFTVSSVLATAARQTEAQKLVEAWLEETPELALNRLEVKGSDVSIVITGAQNFPLFRTSRMRSPSRSAFL